MPQFASIVVVKISLLLLLLASALGVPADHEVCAPSALSPTPAKARDTVPGLQSHEYSIRGWPHGGGVPMCADSSRENVRRR